MKIAPSNIMVKLYPKIGSLAIEENVQAIIRNIVNTANENSHGTIRFSCSYKLSNYVNILIIIMKKILILPCVKQILKSSLSQILLLPQQMKIMQITPTNSLLKYRKHVHKYYSIILIYQV